MYAYVGSRTTRERNARGRGISVYWLDEAQRELTEVQVVEGLVNPSFLALNAMGDVLYTVHGDAQEVSAFRVDRLQGTLTFLNSEDCGGRNPVHLAIDPSGRYLIVSNHLSGTAAVMPLLDDGAVGAVSELVALTGERGPHRVEQPFSKPHFNPFDPSGRFVVLPDKGLDRVFTFRFEDGRMLPTNPPFVMAREGSGPRHIAFHGAGSYAYAVNELDSTVVAYEMNRNEGTLRAIQVLSTLPDCFTGNSRASEIAVDASNRFVYASNRGFDSIAIFAIEGQSGRLRFVEAVPSQGKTPRFFAISPNGRTLFALNEDSDSIIAFSIDAETGNLGHAGTPTACGSPVCLVFGRDPLAASANLKL